MSISVENSAIVEKGATIGDGTKIWYFVHVRKGAKIGKNCNIGDHCYIGEKVLIGDNVRIGNSVSIYEGAIIKDGVFIGNGVSFTNVREPSAEKRADKFLDTIIEEGVSVDANAVLVGGIKIGKFSKVGAGSVVIGDVPPWVKVVGNPARIVRKYKTNE